jgi:SAM-dependent methyltransferase
MIESLLQKYLAGVSARRILDVGPGYASFSRTAARVTGAKEITFLDFDQTVLAWQMEECRKCGVDAVAVTLRLDEKDLSTLPGPYDLIHCQEVLEHLPNAPAMLNALRKQLSPDGRIIVTVPTRVSERWLKVLNPAYMRDDPFGHINEYTRKGLIFLLEAAGLEPLVLLPTQPHYFLGHTWFYGLRMKSEPSTGKILTGGIRRSVFSLIFRGSRWFFSRTGPTFWGRVFPRNYFVVARRINHASTS